MGQGAPQCSVLVSLNPTANVNDYFVTDAVVEDLVYLFTLTDQAVMAPLDYPVRRGEVVFFSCDLAGIVNLWFNPAVI